MKPLIIGVDQEPIYYKIGSYVFLQRPSSLYRLEEGNPVQEVLQMLGFLDYSKLGEQLLVQYFDSLDKDGKIIQVARRVLEFYDATPVHRLWRELRMKLTGATKEKILSKEVMTYGQTARVLLDFFVLNFNSTQPSNASSLTPALN